MNTKTLFLVVAGWFIYAAVNQSWADRCIYLEGQLQIALAHLAGGVLLLAATLYFGKRGETTDET